MNKFALIKRCCIDSTIRFVNFSFSVLLVILERTYVFSSFSKCLDTMTFLTTHIEFTFISKIRMRIFSVAVLFIIVPITNISLTIHESIVTKAVFKIIFPFTFINWTVFIDNSTYSITLSILKVTFIQVSILAYINSSAMRQALLVALTFIFSSIF